MSGYSRSCSCAYCFSVRQQIEKATEELEQVEIERANVSFSLEKAKKDLRNANPNEEDEISTLREKVVYWENKLELAEEERQEAIYNLYLVIGEEEEEQNKKQDDELLVSLKQENCKLICELEASRYEVERLKSEHKTQNKNSVARFNQFYGELLTTKEEKSKLVKELEASRDEVKRLKSAHNMQIKNSVARFNEFYGELLTTKEEKSKLIKELEASRGEVQRLKSEHKMQIKKLVQELEATREEAEKNKKAPEILKSALCKVVSEAVEVKKQNCELELKTKEEKSKLVKELEASRDEVEKSKRASEELRSSLRVVELEKEGHKMNFENVAARSDEIYDELKTTKEDFEEKSKLNKELEVSGEEVEKSNKAKNEKHESMLCLEDWDLVGGEEEEEVQL